jgi:predicted nucleic acid-binding protein
MILVDTSVWIDHFRRGAPRLALALEDSSVLMHAFVLGEIACGNLVNRTEVLELLGDLPRAPLVADAEALAFIENHALMGRGIGYVDVHLLASAVLAGDVQIWTRDRRLAAVASDLGLSYSER